MERLGPTASTTSTAPSSSGHVSVGTGSRRRARTPSEASTIPEPQQSIERLAATETQSRSTEPEILWPFSNRHDDKNALQSFFSQNGCHYRTPTDVMSAFFKARAEKYEELYDLLLDGLLVMFKKETSMQTWRVTLLFWLEIRKADPLLDSCLYKGIQHFQKFDKVDVGPTTGLRSLRSFVNLLDSVEEMLEKDVEAETASSENESSEDER